MKFHVCNKQSSDDDVEDDEETYIGVKQAISSKEEEGWITANLSSIDETLNLWKPSVPSDELYPIIGVGTLVLT